MSLLSTYKNGICIYVNDFTLDEFNTMVSPYLTIRLSYDIECIDIDECDGCVYRAIPFPCIAECIARVLEHEHAYLIYITPTEKE